MNAPPHQPTLLPAGTRPLQPSSDRHHPDSSPPPPPGPLKPTYTKRGKITIVACVYCRRRKTKCDGKRPVCSQCQARDGKCFYDMNEEQRRLTYLRENVEHLAEEKNTLESLIQNLRIGTDEEAFEILRRLRRGTDAQALSEDVQAGRSLNQVQRDSPTTTFSAIAYGPTTPILPPISPRNGAYERLVQVIMHASPQDVDEIVRRMRLEDTVGAILQSYNSGSLLQPLERSHEAEASMVSDYSTRAQTFGLTRVGTRNMPNNEVRASRAPNAHPPLIGIHAWTSISANPDFIEHLLSLYFAWQHSFFQSFPEGLFRHEMEAGKTQYCSKLLVNGICAAGCLLSARPEARSDPGDPLTAGTAFFDESRRIMKDTEVSSIPSVAGLFVLAHVEGYRGRLSMMWDYCGRSARMALDLNLHLRSDRTSSDHLSDEAEVEERARVHAFWGCFIADQLISFTLGRLPQIPTTAITVELPHISKHEDEQPWIPHGDPARARQPGARSTTFHEVASLSKIVNSTLLLFFAPSQVMRGSLLLDEYSKYRQWHDRLPTIVSSTKDAPPHVICLHMYYHAAVLLLFRPFLKAKFTHSDITPSDVCRQSAASISELFAQHRQLYDTVGIYTFQLHCLLTACTIHIINIPAIASTSFLTAACNHFHDLARWNEWATGSLTIIKGLVQKWSIILPGEAELALYRHHQAMELSSMIDDPTLIGSQAEIFRSTKRMAYLNPSSQVIQKRQKLAAPRLPGAIFLESGRQEEGTRSPPASGSSTDGKARDKPRRNRDQQTNYLFAPFPNQPAPLLGPIHTSTSSGSARLDAINDVAHGFDGLSFEGGGGWFDPFMGYAGDRT